MTGQMLEDLIQSSDETLEKILISLLDVDNIEMKTDIPNPLNMSRLEIIGAWLEIEGMTKSSKILELFAGYYRVNRVSFKRKSREEIIKALSSQFSEDRTLGEKLTKPPE